MGKCGLNDLKMASGTGICALEVVQQCQLNLSQIT